MPGHYGHGVGVDIEQINPHNQAALRAWWEVGHAATADRPGKPWPLWEQSRVALPTPNPERGVTLVAAIDGREMVGAGLVIRTLKENLHTAMAFAYVRPDRTREGIGRRLVEELEVVAAGDGRTTIQSEAYLPPGGSGTGPELFARAMGYEVASRESMKELTLADYVARRDALAASAPVPEGYRVVTFDTVCPEEHLASFGRLLGMLMSEVPLGELDLQASEWTPERIREAEQRQVSVGPARADGDGDRPGRLRGRRLRRARRRQRPGPRPGRHHDRRPRPPGQAARAGAQDWRRTTWRSRRWPGLLSVDTSNAEVNTWMNAVNEALGYRTIETLLELQKKL